MTLLGHIHPLTPYVVMLCMGEAYALVYTNTLILMKSRILTEIGETLLLPSKPYIILMTGNRK
jgi:hypothetical protein